MRVKVYWNVHKKVFSVVDKSTGKVVLHTRAIRLSNVWFTINHNARKRIAAGGNKEVHAYVHGTWADHVVYPTQCIERLTYNPRRDEFWKHLGTGKEVTNASAVSLMSPYGFPEVWAEAPGDNLSRTVYLPD